MLPDIDHSMTACTDEHADNPQTIIEIDHLSTRFGEVVVHENLSLKINQGEIVSLAVSYTHLTLPTKA